MQYLTPLACPPVPPALVVPPAPPAAAPPVELSAGPLEPLLQAIPNVDIAASTGTSASLAGAWEKERMFLDGQRVLSD